MSLIDKIAHNAQKVSLKGKCKCSGCRKEINETAYVEPLLFLLGFIHCSRDCIKEHLKYPMTEQAIWRGFAPFL